jgi:hypothetical protein
MAPRMWPESLVIDIRKERDEALRERDYNLSVIKQRNAMLTEAQKERDALTDKLKQARELLRSCLNTLKWD